MASRFATQRQLIRIFSSILCIAGGTLTVESGGQPTWPSWGGPSRNWITDESICFDQWTGGDPEVLWRTNVGTGYTPVTSKNGLVYSSGSRRGVETIYCLNAEDGSVQWKHSYKSELYSLNHDGGPAAAIAIGEALVWSLGRDGDLFCLNAQSGEVVWSTRLDKLLGIKAPFYGYTSSPLLCGDRLIVDSGVVTSFEMDSGTVIWKTRDYGAGYASPVLADSPTETRLAVFNKFGVVLLDLNDGSEYGKYPWKTEFDNNVAAVIPHDNRVFVSSGYEMGCGLIQFEEDTPPEVLYRNQNMRSQFQSCLYHEGRVLGFDGDIGKNSLKGLDFETGEVQWEEKNLSDGSLVIADNKLVILSFTGELIIGDIAGPGFTELQRTHVMGGKCWTPPTVCGGKMYVRNSMGQIVCLDVSCE